MPAFKQYRLKTNNDIPAHFIDLINSPVETLDTIHRGMLKVLTDWRRTQKEKSVVLSEKSKRQMCSEIDDFEIEIERFKLGIDLIRDYSIIRDAFVCMNQAFASISDTIISG